MTRARTIKQSRKKQICSLNFLLSALLGVYFAGQAQVLAEELRWTDALSRGNAAMEQNKPGKAEDSYREAVRLVKLQSKSDDDLDKCLLKLSSALALLDKTAEANKILQTMQNSISKDFGAESPRIAPVLMALGSIQESAGDHDRAMYYYQKALSITEKHYGPYSPFAAELLHGMGKINTGLGKENEAADNYKRAITILSKDPNLQAAKQLERVTHSYKDLLGKNDNSDRSLIQDFQRAIEVPMKTDSRIELPPEGDGQDKKEKSLNSELRPPLAQAKSQWQEQSQSQISTYRRSETDENTDVQLRGIDLPTTNKTLMPAFKVMDSTISRQNRYGMGESQYQRMIAADIDALGPSHPSVANDMSGLAQLYMAQEKYSEARPLLLKALGIYLQAYGKDNALTIGTQASLATVEFQLGETDKAKALFNEALASSQSTLGPNSLETAKILNGIAFLYFRSGDLEKANTFYKWALASTEKAVGKQDPLLAACLSDYAQVLHRLGNNSEATEMELRASEIMSSRSSAKP